MPLSILLSPLTVDGHTLALHLFIQTETCKPSHSWRLRRRPLVAPFGNPARISPDGIAANHWWELLVSSANFEIHNKFRLNFRITDINIYSKYIKKTTEHKAELCDNPVMRGSQSCEHPLQASRQLPMHGYGPSPILTQGNLLRSLSWRILLKFWTNPATLCSLVFT